MPFKKKKKIQIYWPNKYGNKKQKNQRKEGTGGILASTEYPPVPSPGALPLPSALMYTLSALSEKNRLASWTVNAEDETSILTLRWEPHTLLPSGAGTPGQSQRTPSSPDTVGPPETLAFSPPDVKPFDSSSRSAAAWMEKTVRDCDRESKAHGLPSRGVKVETSSLSCANRSCAQSSCPRVVDSSGGTAERRSLDTAVCPAVGPSSGLNATASPAARSSSNSDSTVSQTDRFGLLAGNHLDTVSHTERFSRHLDSSSSQALRPSIPDSSFPASTTTTTTTPNKPDCVESEEEEEYEEDYESEEDIATYLPRYSTGAYHPTHFYYNTGTALACCGYCISNFLSTSYSSESPLHPDKVYHLVFNHTLSCTE